MISYGDLNRRDLLIGGAALGAALSFGGPAVAQVTTTAAAQKDSAVSDQIAAEFLGSATPIEGGVILALPALADNPSAVPVHVTFDTPFTEALWCEEVIVLAERNPAPLACRFRFGAAAGKVDVAVRVRLIETMRLRAIAKMSDGTFRQAYAETTVAAGGCGM